MRPRQMHVGSDVVLASYVNVLIVHAPAEIMLLPINYAKKRLVSSGSNEKGKKLEGRALSGHNL